MAHLCDCGEELFVHVSDKKRTTYCPNCGREEETQVSPKPVAPVISITRAAILKKINTPPPEQKKPKQLKQHRDRRDYTAARRTR